MASANVVQLDFSDSVKGDIAFVRHSIKKRDADDKCIGQERKFLQNPKEKQIDKVVRFCRA